MFVVPEIDNLKEAEVRLNWRGFPSDWQLANSFGVGEKSQIISSPNHLKHAVYVGGDFRFIMCGTESAPMIIAIRGKWSFSDQKLTHFIDTIATAQSQFWRDNFPYYLITWVPLGQLDPAGFSFTGTCLYNSYAVFMEGDLSDEQEASWKALAGLLGHEYFHNWLGIKINVQDSERALLQWFFEGFTEYYGHLLNYRSQLTSCDDYLKQINQILYEYYSSSVRFEKNERIAQDFWKDPEVRRLPYLRGFLFALYWDKKIRDSSSRKYCLDDFMRALFAQVTKSQEGVSQEKIEKMASRFLLLEDVQDDLERYIVNGELLIPPETTIDRLGYLEWSQDLGFLVQAEQGEMKVVQVKENGLAFQWGLREGHRVLFYQCIDREVTVHFIDWGGQKQKISYEIDLVPKFFPLYRGSSEKTGAGGGLARTSHKPLEKLGASVFQVFQ